VVVEFKYFSKHIFGININKDLLLKLRPSSSFEVDVYLREFRHMQNIVLSQLVSATGAAIFHELFVWRRSEMWCYAFGMQAPFCKDLLVRAKVIL
jgi:hypothetical protein